MYPITNPHEGQRITLFNKPVIGTVAVIRDRRTVIVQWDDGQRSMCYLSDIAALIPGNDDGYFDPPCGYFAAT